MASASVVLSSSHILFSRFQDDKSLLCLRRRTPSSRSRRCRAPAFAVSPKAVQTEAREEAVTLSNQQRKLQGKEIKLRGELLLQKKSLLDLSDGFADFIDDVADTLGRKVWLQLVSEEVDPVTGKARVTEEVAVPNWTSSVDGLVSRDASYEIEFIIDSRFGKPGAILIRNEHFTEFLLKQLSLETMDGTKLCNFICNSWVYPPSARIPRVFFSDKMCLPEETPAGIRELRRDELRTMQGDGTGKRIASDRIYDYDVYNDLGNPDKSLELRRPVLGGSIFPYPRRVRTGRPRTKTDAQAESVLEGLLENNYVPADEDFHKTKNSDFLGDTLKSVAQQIIPRIKIRLFSDVFRSFEEVRSLYYRGVKVKPIVEPGPFTFINQLIGDPTNESLIRFPLPQVIKVSNDAWMSDEEFARQTIAGMNPLLITKLKSFPPKSSLDPAIYGEGSALKNKDIQPQLEGLTVEKALEMNKLFIVDYHDVFLPYLNKINAIKGRQSYASRAILFLSNDGTLKTVAVELSLPPAKDGPAQRNNRVFLPSDERWVWELAKGHFAANDCGFHQLVSHWLRTHACMEPFVIATNRHLSAAHPINCLLKPHFRYTMSINGRARKSLVQASGIIEENFTPGEFSLELSAVAYKLLWRFDQEGVPGDLISRGMATPNPSVKYGLELAIPDYPYAVDALNIWFAIKEWVIDYTNIFYGDDSKIQSDGELQSWWHELVNVGHGDKRNEEWWPKMNCKSDLVDTLTTIMWIGSGQHASVNFGQFAYAGFHPNKPTIAHKFVPEKGSAEYRELLRNGEEYFLSAFSTKAEAVAVLSTLEILSTHADDEEYLGGERPGNWTSNSKVREAYGRFSAAIKEIEKGITARNKDPSLQNRRGPVEMKYTLLQPSSKPGLTGMGVPNSISI